MRLYSKCLVTWCVYSKWCWLKCLWWKMNLAKQRTSISFNKWSIFSFFSIELLFLFRGVGDVCDAVRSNACPFIESAKDLSFSELILGKLPLTDSLVMEGRKSVLSLDILWRCIEGLSRQLYCVFTCVSWLDHGQEHLPQKSEILSDNKLIKILQLFPTFLPKDLL